MAGSAERPLLDTLLACCKERGWLKARGRQRTDSTNVLAAIHTLNRLELVQERVRHARDVLTLVAPTWLLAHSQNEWIDCDGHRAEDDRLPSKKAEREARQKRLQTPPLSP